jgi:membrane dipeptidase
MIIFDGHVHLALDALRLNRDVTRSVVEIRQSEAGMTERMRGRGTISLPDMRRGNIALCFALVAVSTDPEAKVGHSYRTPEATYAYAQAELAYYRVLEAEGALRMIKDSSMLESHIAQWKDVNQASVPLGFVLAMEGSDPVLSPRELEAWWEDGLRVASLSHYSMGRYAAGTGPSGGVTPAGRELLGEMDRLGVVLDVAHLSEQAFWEAIELFRGSVAFTHGGMRALVPMWRSLSDEQLMVLIERGGVVGISMDNWQIHRGWVRGQSTPELVSLEEVVDHIDHICQLAGSSDHAAIGTDLDGSFGTEQTPRELDTIADLQKIHPILRCRGYSEEDIGKIMHGNWMRLLCQAWGDG